MANTREVKTKQIECFSPADYIPTDADVCISLTNMEDFQNTFALSDDVWKRGYFPPFKILANLENKVIPDYHRKGYVDGMYSASYGEDYSRDAIFHFDGFKYDNDRKVLTIELSFWSTVS